MYTEFRPSKFQRLQFYLNYYLDYYFPFVKKHRKEMEKTISIKNSKKGKAALVLANGPSVNKLDPKKIQALQIKGKFEVWALNFFLLSELSEFIVPDFYCLSDGKFFDSETDIDPTLAQKIQEINKKVKELNIPVFIPVHRIGNKNPFSKYFPFNDYEDFPSINVSDITKPRGYVTMTAYKALSIAIYLGYDQIYIAGFDNDYFKKYFVDKDNIIFLKDDHFYDSKGSDTLVKAPQADGRTIGEHLHSIHFLFKHLEKFKKFNIINLDPYGLVDCFPKHHNLDVYN